MKVRIVPTILVPNYLEFEKRVKFLEKYFSLVQIDCADGKFVQNKTFYRVNEIKKVLGVNFELHLMVKDPLTEIKKWLKVKKLKSIIFHYEAVGDPERILSIINCLKKSRVAGSASGGKKIKVGLAINPSTKVEKIKEFLPYLDEVLLLGVNPGWGGKKMKLKVVKLKVRKVRKLAPKIDIGVDGGVNLQNARQIIKAGANVLYAGYSLSNINNIKTYQTLIKNF